MTSRRDKGLQNEIARSSRVDELMKAGHMEEAAREVTRWLDQTPGSRAAVRLALFLLPYRLGLDQFATFRETAAIFSKIRLPPRRVVVSSRHSPLRVGWLSADLCAHPVGRNLIPVIEALPLRHFFYSDTAKHDHLTERFHRRASTWRETRGIPDADLAEIVRQDELDILVIVAGRFNDNRFAFAIHRAAPVQVSLHDVATSGLPNMDYLILDRFTAPHQILKYHTERVIRLPSFYIHEPLDAPEVGALPLGTNGYVTFGCLNNPAKITRDTLAAWARIMRDVPHSRLLLAYSDTYSNHEVYRRVVGALRSTGTDQNRLIVIRDKRSPEAQWALYRQIDIALDPFPFTGSTTTFEALSMGVPVVTLAGATPASRWSGSMLKVIGLNDLIASDTDGYVSLATALAADEGRLTELHATLRGRLMCSPLCNANLRGRQFLRLFTALTRDRSTRDQRLGALNVLSTPPAS